MPLLPNGISYEAYYWLQRHFGGLRKAAPAAGLTAGVETWRRLQGQGMVPAGKIFFEVGTGREPLAYWLMGAQKTITVDLNLYLKKELVAESVD